MFHNVCLIPYSSYFRIPYLVAAVSTTGALPLIVPRFGSSVFPFMFPLYSPRADSRIHVTTKKGANGNGKS